MSQESTSPSVGADTQENTGIQQGLADRAEALHGVARIRENLGHVAAGHEVHADPHGNLLLDRDLEEIKARGNQDDRPI